MKRKGIGAVVGTVVIILISVVGVTILLGAYLRSVDKGTSNDASSCFGIDLKATSCNIISPDLFNQAGLPDTKNGTLINVERFPGGGEITGLKFVITDSLGNVHIGEPADLPMLARFGLNIDTDYSDLIEYNSVEAIVRNITYIPVSVSVGAVVGDSKTVCAPTRDAVACK